MTDAVRSDWRARYDTGGEAMEDLLDEYEAEIERLREAGDALADAVTDVADPESVLRTWACRWREVRLASDEEEYA